MSAENKNGASTKADAPAEVAAETKPGGKREPPKDAFSELMTRKKAKPHMMHHPRPHGFGGNARWRVGGGAGAGAGRAAAGALLDAGRRTFLGPEALGAYIADPTSKASRDAVVFFDDSVVAVHDKFPKASVHCLLLPRNAAYTHEQPLTLLSRCRTDPEVAAFLAHLKSEAAKLVRIVAADLARRFGQYSAADAARQAALRGGKGEGESESEAGQLPDGRDWEKEVVVGVHARPSMVHLHVHVMSRDMHSDKMRHRKHYNSFNTPFLVGLDEFPLAKTDPRLPEGGMADEDAGDADGAVGGGDMDSTSETRGKTDYLKTDLVCWRCGRNFGNKFAELKRHLDVEFEAWKKE